MEIFLRPMTIISITNVNPLTMSHLYETVVRTSVLYGCELWNAITQEVVRRLNTLQHGICKSYLEPTKTNNIRYVLTAPKSHSNYGRN